MQKQRKVDSRQASFEGTSLQDGGPALPPRPPVVLSDTRSDARYLQGKFLMKTFIYCAMVLVFVSQALEHCERSQNMHNFNENVDRNFKESTQDLGDGIPRPLVDVTPPPKRCCIYERPKARNSVNPDAVPKSMRATFACDCKGAR